MDPIDPADAREWEIHRAFEEKDRRIETLTRWNTNAARLRDEAEAAKEKAEKVLYQAEELLQELADVVKSGKGCVDCGVVVRPYEINELHYKVIAFLCRRGRVYP